MAFYRFTPVALLASTVGIAAAQAHKHKNYDLIDVSYRISMDARNEVVFGTCTNTLVLQEDATRVAFDFAKLGINSISVNGKPATSSAEGEMIWVQLPSAGKKGERLKVTIDYGGRPEAGIYFVPAARAYPSKTPMVYTQGEAEDTRYWLPTYDYPDDKATSEAWLEVLRDWTAIGNGRLVDISFNQTNKVFHWKMDQPHATYLNSIVAGPYVEGKEMWGKMPVSYFVPPGLEEEGKASFANTNEMIDLFSKLTGFKYPYAKFAQSTVADYMFGGMENISAVTQTIGTLHPVDTEPLSSSKGLVLHELAHQWFGDTITCNDWSHIWLNEGFASFLPSFWVREHEGEDAFDLSRYDTFNGGLGAMAGEPRPVVNPNYEIPMDNFDGHAYAGGATRMFMLMELLGEKTFWNSIKNFLNQYKFKSPTTEQFFASVEKSSGKNLKQFMQQWFYTPEMPNLTVAREGGSFTITLGDKSPFMLDLPIWILQDGKWLKSNISIANRPVVLGDVKGLVLVDPEVRLATNLTYSFDYTNAEWESLYKAMPNAAGRARMIDLFRSKGKQDLLTRLLSGEKSEKVVVRLINACSSLPAAQVSGLLNSLSPFIKEATLRQAAKLSGDKSIAEQIRTMMSKEPNSQLKLQEFSALGRITNDTSMVIQAWMTDSWNDGYRAMALDVWFNTDKDQCREKCLEILEKPTTEPLRQNAIRKLGSLKDKPGERRVFDALVKVVQETSFGARNGAISALGEYGDKAALPYLEPLTTNSMFYIARSAKSAVERLNR